MALNLAEQNVAHQLVAAIDILIEIGHTVIVHPNSEVGQVHRHGLVALPWARCAVKQREMC